MSALPPLSIDMYLPAMPQMARDLHTSPELVQLSLTVFVVGLALGQIVVGPMSDTWGRRRPLLVGLAVYTLGSVGCLLATTAPLLIGARIVESLGAAAGTVLARAIVRDHFEGPALARFFSTLMLVGGVAPVAAPVIGGQLLTVAPWPAVFAVLGVLGLLLTLAVVFGLPESLPEAARRPGSLRGTLRVYGMLVRDGDYMRAIGSSALMFAAMFCYIAASSFVLQETYGLSAQQFSLVFGVNGLGIVVLGQINGRIVGRVASERRLLALSLAAGALGAIGVLACTALELPFTALAPCLFLTVAVVGPVLANSTSLALANHGSAAGAASSLLGLSQFLVGGLAASALGVIPADQSLAMGIAMCVCACAALAVFLSGRRG